MLRLRMHVLLAMWRGWLRAHRLASRIAAASACVGSGAGTMPSAAARQAERRLQHQYSHTGRGWRSCRVCMPHANGLLGSCCCCCTLGGAEATTSVVVSLRTVACKQQCRLEALFLWDGNGINQAELLDMAHQRRHAWQAAGTQTRRHTDADADTQQQAAAVAAAATSAAHAERARIGAIWLSVCSWTCARARDAAAADAAPSCIGVATAQAHHGSAALRRGWGPGQNCETACASSSAVSGLRVHTQCKQAGAGS